MDYQAIIDKASAAGTAASQAMLAQYPQLDAGGCCGFAWVKVKGNTPFGRYAKKAGIARPGYPTGLTFWCPLMTQSIDLKEAWASAFASSLRESGVTDAYSESRLD